MTCMCSSKSEHASRAVAAEVQHYTYKMEEGNKKLEEAMKRIVMETSYIKLLAQNTSTDISSWDLTKVFGDVTDRRDINKRFFEQVKSLAPAQKEPEKVVVPQTSRNSLDNRRVVSKLETIIRRERKKTQRLADKMDEIQKRIVKTNNKIAEVKGRASSSFIEEQINSIVKDGFWECPIFKGKYFYLNTKNDVIMHRTQNTDTLNFGKFGVSIDMSNFDLRLLAYENNITYDTYHNGVIHPYGFRQRNICFGSAVRTVASLKANLDLVGIMRLLAALLTTYDDNSSPVAYFHDFTQDRKLDYMKYMKVYDRSTWDRNMHPALIEKYGAL